MKVPVVYINFELHAWAVGQRINSLAGARPECKGLGDTLFLWNLRGHNADSQRSSPALPRRNKNAR